MIDRRAAVAAVVTVLLWASAFVGIRDLADAFSPGSIALARLMVGTLLLGALLWRRGWSPVSRRDVVLIALSGVCWLPLYNLALNEAERHVDAGTASMLVNTGPILIALFAGLFLGEGLPRRLLVGLGIAFAGAIVIGVATSQASAGQGSADELGGIVLCVVAAVAYAMGVTLQKPATRNLPALQLTWLAFAVGLLVCLPFLPGLASEVAAVAATPVAATKVGWLLYLGIFPTSIGFTTWAYALARTTAGRLGVTTYLIPPVAIGISWVLLGEVPPPLALLGGALCIGGVVVVRAQGLRRRPATPGPIAEPGRAGISR